MRASLETSMRIHQRRLHAPSALSAITLQQTQPPVFSVRLAHMLMQMGPQRA
jgi:hypothetical protein